MQATQKARPLSLRKDYLGTSQHRAGTHVVLELRKPRLSVTLSLNDWLSSVFLGSCLFFTHSLAGAYWAASALRQQAYHQEREVFLVPFILYFGDVGN